LAEILEHNSKTEHFLRLTGVERLAEFLKIFQIVMRHLTARNAKTRCATSPLEARRTHENQKVVCLYGFLAQAQ
jgi:hypothetical protein